MKADELITFCTLKGDVNLHVCLKDDYGNPSNFYHIRLRLTNAVLSFQYHKDEDDKLTFIKGQALTQREDIGTNSTPIHGFKHMMETYLK